MSLYADMHAQKQKIFLWGDYRIFFFKYKNNKHKIQFTMQFNKYVFNN